MRIGVKLLLVVGATALVWPFASHSPAASRQARLTVTVSGTVRGPYGPVPDTFINVNSPGLPFSENTTTDSRGFYRVTLQTEGLLHVFARPPYATRLAQVILQIEGVRGSFIQDVGVEPGYLLSIRATDEGHRPLGCIGGEIQVSSLTGRLPSPPGNVYHLGWDEALGRYEGVLPPDVYTARIDSPPPGYYPTTAYFDLRAADQSVDLILGTTPPNPKVDYPPDATRITIGPPDGLGEAVVTGAPGAVLPTAHVLLTNLNAWTLGHAISNADGSFSARIYAPPGSAVFIQHCSLGWLWPGGAPVQQAVNDSISLYPGTLITIPHSHRGGPGELPFAAAGSVDYVQTGLTHIGAGWAITGTLRRAGTPSGDYSCADQFTPGDALEIAGELRLYGHGITPATDLGRISIGGWLRFLQFYNGQGVPIEPDLPTITSRLTVSGLPIRDRYTNGIDCSFDRFEVSGLRRIGEHCLSGQLRATGRIPADMPAGVYIPVIAFRFAGVPTSDGWPAPQGEISWRNYRENEAGLPPITVAVGGQSSGEPRRMVWRLLMDEIIQGVHGAGACEDTGVVGLNTFIVTQEAAYVLPMVSPRTGQPLTYRLEPYLPMITTGNSNGHLPLSPPLLGLALPGGSLRVTIQRPDGTVRDLGSDTFARSSLCALSTSNGYPVNYATIHVYHPYSLMAASDRFRVTFDRYGHHVITMTGEVSDLWGNRYTGGGTYDVWVAELLSIEPGVVPGTPLEVGDTFNPAVQLLPGVPAWVEWTVTEYPNSDPARAIRHRVTGWANRTGYFAGTGFALSAPGEYRVDLVARYTDPAGVMYMGSMTWGSVVMTPAAQAQLVAHGRRGTNNLASFPAPWFVFCRDLDTIPGWTYHAFAAYFRGDILWSRPETAPQCEGSALITGGSVQDTAGALEPRIRQRAERMPLNWDPPGGLDERLAHGEIPLFTSTRSGRTPELVPDEIDQIAYMYFYSERPGVRVREEIVEDYTMPGYWRLATEYDGQPGVGVLGDLPNDYKFQYIGAVYRDLESGHSEYLGHGSGWVRLPADDPLGSRVMPPFAGPGNGGWTTEGGPIMRLKGQEIHMFIQPTGTQPGAILQVGDAFRFAGHLMPTLDSQVAVTVTSPSGARHVGGGRANRVGYYYNPADDFTVGEPGLWAVDVRVWHDGMCSGGHTVPPYPSGDVLGSDHGRYWFYVVPKGSPRLSVSAPAPGFLSFRNGVTPIAISGTVPVTITGAIVDYTITMPGFILQHGRTDVASGRYTITFDPVALARDFPNLDLVGRDDPNQPGLADTFRIGLLLQGRDPAGRPVQRANCLVLQGEQLLVSNSPGPELRRVDLPLITTP